MQVADGIKVTEWLPLEQGDRLIRITQVEPM